ncbi:MAG TPA: S8 family serine peptidase [Anaerolineales bacterium]|nr:S8 family serine peptidase [Anaerolineales bacterium]
MKLLRLLLLQIVAVLLFFSGILPGMAQSAGSQLRLTSLYRGFNPIMSLSGIEIPKGAKIGCNPFSRTATDDRRLTFSPGGSYFNGVLILTGVPAEVARVAREALGETKPIHTRPLQYLGEYVQGADTPEKIQELLRYSQQSVSLYATGALPGGGVRPVLDALKAVLEASLALYQAGAISMPVFADLNYVTGFPDVAGNPWSISGSPWGVDGNPWSISGSPWSISGSPVSGTDAEKLELTQAIAEGAFWRQWAFQERGVNVYDSAFQRTLPDAADGSGSRVVLFDTAPYTSAGLANETRQRLSVNLCVHLVPLPAIDASPDKTGYMRDHGLFGVGLTFAAAPQSELHLVRVLDDNAIGDLYSLTAGIDGMTQATLPQNAGTLRRVVYNFSLGLKPIGSELPQELRELMLKIVDAMPADERPELVNGLPLQSLEIPLRTAYNLGAVVIASAGNDSAGLSKPEPQNIPAAYSFVLGVQSTNMAQRQSCYSNTGEVGAPGGDGGLAPDCEPQLQLCNAATPCDYGLVSLVSERSDTVGFAYWVGSSFAAPLVSGVAADALEGGVTYDKVTAYIAQSALRTGVVDAPAATKP